MRPTGTGRTCPICKTRAARALMAVQRSGVGASRSESGRLGRFGSNKLGVLRRLGKHGLPAFFAHLPIFSVTWRSWSVKNFKRGPAGCAGGQPGPLPVKNWFSRVGSSIALFGRRFPKIHGASQSVLAPGGGNAWGHLWVNTGPLAVVPGGPTGLKSSVRQAVCPVSERHWPSRSP